MRRSLFLVTLTMAAAAAFSGVTPSQAGFPAPPGLPALGVNVQVEGYFPAPPGVHVYVEGGRPYYLKGGRHVYLEKDRRHNGKHRGHGHKKGHGKH